MTNRIKNLPEYGKKYKLKIPYKSRSENLELGEIIEVRGICCFDNGIIGVETVNYKIALEFFINFCEKLPDQPTSAKSAQVASEKVEKALIEFKKEFRKVYYHTPIDSRKAAHKLIDALEEQEQKN